ncbi:MAG: trypsin-like serine protease, partial [Proteobacteria bacterium]|nr:trypsin-like serine protease [Pseudomonadota bacterium]
MIHKKIVEKMALSVCAIERMDMTLADLRTLAASKGDKISASDLEQEVLGTGFIVKEGWVLTNRHVVDAMIADISKRGEKNLDHWFLEWVHPNKTGGWSSVLKQVMLAAPMTVEGNTGLDVALIRYTHKD